MRARTPALDPPEARKMRLTHPDRVLYPRDGFTKQDVADYYDAVADPLLRAVAGRPLVLKHWPKGIAAPSWFRQGVRRDEAAGLDAFERRARTRAGTVRHLLANRREALRWIAQHSALEIHMWSSRASRPNTPDWIVFDCDPSPTGGIEQAVEGALALRRLLDRLELPSVPKTSGKRGIHVLVPTAHRYDHERAVQWARALVQVLAGMHPFITTERTPARRRGRLYMDWLQNGFGKTIVAPYSLRGVDGAPVSAPLRWSEVSGRLDPSRFNLRTMPGRLEKVGDLFAPALRAGARLPDERSFADAAG
jgi:bifunctional non-homologous end joining protein LigD